MKNPEGINFNDVLFENIDIQIPINNLLSTPPLTHNHGNSVDMVIKSNLNVSHIEKMEKYIEVERLKQNIIKDKLKQYQVITCQFIT